jgi:hypothetical protein
MIMGLGMEPSVRTLLDWLQGQANNTIVIQKKEQRDLDKVRLQLDEVGYQADYKSIDGYTDGSALVLHGSGTIFTDTEEAPLPGDSYVIQVNGLNVTKASEDGVIIQTDRAHYSISADNTDRQ